MAVSPLERDAIVKVDPHSTNHLRAPIIIRRGPRSFGFTLRAVKVFHGNTDYYTTQHVVTAVQGSAEKAGLRPNDVITHVNEYPVAGLFHSEVVKLILAGSQKLSIRAMPCSETQIRAGGRRRSPSKQKLRYQQIQHQNSSEHHHQPHCQKYRLNSSGGSTHKKHSLFRRLSERRVARDLEAAAAAGVPSTTKNTRTEAIANTTTLSSSLPLLSSQPLATEPSSSHSTPAARPAPPSPSSIKRKSQVDTFSPHVNDHQHSLLSLYRFLFDPRFRTRHSRPAVIPRDQINPSVKLSPNHSVHPVPR